MDPAERVTAFVGGGNMAAALIGGLRRAGRPADAIVVVEPHAAARERLQRDFGVTAQPAADAALARADTIVWAVKPQSFAEAAAPCARFVAGALQVSVMAGVRAGAIARAAGTPRVVRVMPNTPALIGRGIAALWADASVGETERAQVQALLAPTGATLWVAHEQDLDAVTALSASGPAYVFYLLEALIDGGVAMGLRPEQARALALGTLDGATALAAGSSEPPQTLRAQVTSRGGTTHAAISVLEQADVKAAVHRALLAAQRRARELGDEFGG